MEEKNTYFPISQKRYSQKCKIYTVKYFPNEIDTVNEIEIAIESTKLSANAWIKNAILEKLKRDMDS